MCRSVTNYLDSLGGQRLAERFNCFKPDEAFASHRTAQYNKYPIKSYRLGQKLSNL